jgi:hypothetical protein
MYTAAAAVVVATEAVAAAAAATAHQHNPAQVYTTKLQPNTPAISSFKVKIFNGDDIQ